MKTTKTTLYCAQFCETGEGPVEKSPTYKRDFNIRAVSAREAVKKAAKRWGLVRVKALKGGACPNSCPKGFYEGRDPDDTAQYFYVNSRKWLTKNWG